jgi:hypothetical protein
VFHLIAKLFGTKHSEEELVYRDTTWKAIEKLITEESKKDVANWVKFKAKALEEIDEKIQYARSVGRSPQELERERTDKINKELERKHNLLTRGYVLAVEDYKADIYPNLLRLTFFPGRGGAAWGGEEIEHVVYRLSSPEYQVSGEAKDKLLGKCDVYAVSGIVKTMRRNYERLRCAELAEHKRVLLLENHKACHSCNERGSDASIQELLAEYSSASLRFPHEIPWEDEVQYCEGPHLMPQLRAHTLAR